MAGNYHPLEIEKKWLEKWLAKPLHQPADFDKKPKYYALVEFPYPSGEGLHLGHAFTNIILDVLARFKRLKGFNVLHPMGWDSFGLPTENSAIKTGVPPARLTERNTARFKAQNQRLGVSYDWEREIDTSNPAYYRWTQWIFIQLFKHGLAYKAETPVGWCPSCKIILANEEIVNGNCERCGTPSEQRRQSQWLLKITAYADRLADDLDLVDYPDYIKNSQRNWIGRSEGVEIEYPVIDSKLTVSCYSTRPDTNFGATFVVMAPEHPLVGKLTTQENKKAVSEYIKKATNKSELERTELQKDKTGVFTGSYALNRLTNRKMPIYVADFVVLTAGTGIVVGVPAHDERDFAFAKKYGLEIMPVVKPQIGEWNFPKSPFTDIDEAEVFNSDFLNGLPPLKAKEKMIDYLVEKGWGKRAKNYHLRDWIFSRQHYWGEPIPMINCPKCGWQPVPEKDLPLKLPEVEKHQPTDTGESPLAKIKDWVETTCPKCGGQARRETDTMPNWAGSSWYYLRFCDPHNDRVLADSKKLKYWLPVDLYLGGAEHTTLHLLYSRFWHKFLNDLKLVPGKEPYQARRQHGIILGENGEKMSKSKGNVIDPLQVADKFGADTLRLYLMFMGPYESTMPWSAKGLEGCWRFLNRVWALYTNTNKIAKTTSPELVIKLQKLIKKVDQNLENLKHNTVVAGLMDFVNFWQDGVLSAKDAAKFCQLLAPLAPFISEEIWTEFLKNKDSVHLSAWPAVDERSLKTEPVEIIVQVNGRLRGSLRMINQKSRIQEEVEQVARKEGKVAAYLAGKKIKKVVFVPGKLINFVI